MLWRRKEELTLRHLVSLPGEAAPDGHFPGQDRQKGCLGRISSLSA